MQVQERIRKIADELFNGNISAFCRAIDVKQPTMNTILGERKSKPSYDVLLNIVNAKALNISAEWLLNGEGDMLTQKKEAPKTSSADTTKKNGYITYLLPMSAMGGSLTGFAEPGVLLQNCEAVVSPIENVDFAITVYGDSMAPEYPSGSRILIKKINPNLFIDWGKVYVLDTPNGVIVKEVHESNRKVIVQLLANTPYFHVNKTSIIY